MYRIIHTAGLTRLSPSVVRPVCIIRATYPLERRVGHLMSVSDGDRWLEMDTYYFSTGRFLDSFRCYLQYVRLDNVGVGMMNRDDFTIVGLQARFQAMDASGVDWIKVFILPVQEELLPWLKRWKTRCEGCGVQPVLGCYDMEVVCDDGLSASTK